MRTGETFSGYGTSVYPTFGAAGIDTSKSGVANTIAGAFNNLPKNFSGLTVVAGNEIKVEQAWLLIEQAHALLTSAYCGKSMVGNA